MSSFQREKTGQWHAAKPNPVRSKYLAWLEGFLDAQRVGDRDLKRLLRGQLLPYRHPLEHRVRANTGRLAARLRLALSRLRRRMPGRHTGSLVAHPNPIRPTNGLGLGKTTLSWRSSNTEAVEVHVGAPDGSLLSRSGASGSATTDEWVADGMAFYLQDVSGGRPLSAANTLDILTLRVASGDDGPRGLPARLARWVTRHAAPPWKGRRVNHTPPVGRVRFGDLARRTPINCDWGFDRGRPVSRYYIERFLGSHAGDIRGRVAEFGDDSYTRRFGGDGVATRDVINVKIGRASCRERV
jgi:hypothetical protein